MKKFLKSIVVKRLSLTIFLLFIFVLGTKIPLPFVDTNSPNFAGGAATSLAFSTALMGGNLTSLSLFSVGISPWMSTVLLWQMFTMSKSLGIGNLPQEVQERRKMYLTFGVALIQALAVTLALPVQDGYNSLLVRVMNTLLLIAGTFFLVWLSDINSLLGLGGPMIILMAGMMISIPQNILRSIQEFQIGIEIIIPLIVVGILFLYLNVLTFRARYRIPVNKISIHNRFKKYSYLDIMLNPGGGMAFMYAMTFVSLPQYILMLIQFLYPNNGWTASAISNMMIGTPTWLMIYFSTLVILSIAFAFVNLSGEQIAERMKKSGEYIYGIYPGVDTSRYINKIVLRFAVFGAVYSLLMGGAPMLVTLINPQYLQLTMIPGIFLMFTGMVFTVKEEVAALTLNENYTPLI